MMTRSQILFSPNPIENAGKCLGTPTSLFTYISGPTLAIAPILLDDMRRVAVERKGETNFFTSQMIKDCMKKVVACNLHQVVKVDDELEIKAYYAGKCKHIHLFSESILIVIFGVLENKDGKYSRNYIFQNLLLIRNRKREPL